MAYDPSLFEQQRRNLLGNFAQQSALNAYQRYLAETRGQRPILNLEEAAFSRTPTGGLGEVPKLTSSYARRGLQGKGMRSGIYNEALSSYAKNRARQLGYAREDQAGALRGLDVQKTGYESDLSTGMQDLEANKARQIAADAKALLELR
jgi:hypothetical protein